jgi:HK97 family phage major capsid protein
VTKAQELLKKEGLSAEDRTAFDGFMGEADTIKLDIDRMERAEAADAELRGSQRPPNDPVGGGQPDAIGEYRTALRRHGAKAIELVRPETRALVEKYNEQYWQAFRNVSLRGLSGVSDEDRAAFTGTRKEFRDMGISVSTDGGYFVPQGYVYKIEEAMKYYGDMLNTSEILDTASGQPLPYPTDNDVSNMGEITGEGQQVTEQDVTTGRIMFGAEKFDSKIVKVSLELLQDSAFDIESYLQKKFAIRMGRIYNNKFTVGQGNSASPVEPTGIITATVANNGTPQLWGGGSGPGIPVIAAGDPNNASPDGGSQVGWPDLVNLEHSVDPLYRKQGAKWMMHDTTLRFLKTTTDKYGRPLFLPGVAVNAPDTIYGYPFSINNDMAQIADNAVTVAFGQLNKYLIRRVKEFALVVLRERFIDYGQIGYLGFSRADGNLLDAGTHPVNYLKQASS